MAYHIGQLRKQPNTIYMWLISEQENPPSTEEQTESETYPGTSYMEGLVDRICPNDFNTSDHLRDFGIGFKSDVTIDEGSIDRPTQKYFVANRSYFLNCKIKLPKETERQHNLSYSIILKAKDESEKDENIKDKETANPPQTIGTLTIPLDVNEQQGDQYIYYSLVFTPRKNADYLIFRYNRKAIDYYTQTVQQGENSQNKPYLENWLSEKEGDQFKNITFIDGNEGYGIYILNNLVTTPTWIRLGYQSRPGNLIVVNKEPIRVGRSGIFQLDKIQVDSFMIAAPKGSHWSTIDPFLLDYAYNS